MSNYRSEYEKYYKNINNPNKNNNNYISNKVSVGHSVGHSKINSMQSEAILNKYFSMEYWSKRIIRELSGAFILLVLFAGLKCVYKGANNQTYLYCKSLISTNFNYDNTIEAMAGISIGNSKAKDFKIGNYTIYDLKYENLQKQAINLQNYIGNQFVNFKEYMENTMKEKK